MFFRLVRRHHGGAAGGRHNTDTFSGPRHTGAGEEIRGLQKPIETIDGNGPGFGNRGIECLSGTNHCSGVGHCRLPAEFPDAHLIDQQRLTVIIGFLRGLDKASAVFHAFEKANNDVGSGIFREKGNIVADIDIAGITGGKIFANTDAALHPLKQRVTKSAALGYNGYRPVDELGFVKAGHEI